MKTSDFAKLLRKVAAATGDDEIGIALNSVARVVENHPEAFRKPLQRVQQEPALEPGEVRDALVTIKLFLVQPTLCGHIDQVLNNRAKIAMRRLWNALLPDYEEAQIVACYPCSDKAGTAALGAEYHVTHRVGEVCPETGEKVGA